jgi:hypothetical protein
MFKSLQKELMQWFKATDDRVKLQHSLLATVVVLFVASGLINLLNPRIGDIILQLAYVFIGAFLVNALVWALLHAFVFPHLVAKSTRTPRK